MTAKGTNGKVDMGRWHRNRVSVDLNMLDSFVGKHIAWNADATRVVTSGDSLEEVYQKLDAMGVANDEVVHEFVDDGTPRV